MTISLFHHARFEVSVADPQNLPQGGPEIAFAGRSNAGKSSAINALAGQTRLAYVSKTPGRTQLINVFRLKCGAALIDLPGYGFSVAPDAVRTRWPRLIEQYLTQRAALIGLVLIMDARRPFTDLDRQMIEWFRPAGKPIHCLLSKADKLSRQAQAKTLAAAREISRRAFPSVPISLQLFSSLKRTGIDEAERKIGTWLDSSLGMKEKGLSAKGEKAESPNASTGIEAPAQGGKAGDGSSPSMH